MYAWIVVYRLYTRGLLAYIAPLLPQALSTLWDNHTYLMGKCKKDITPVC